MNTQRNCNHSSIKTQNKAIYALKRLKVSRQKNWPRVEKIEHTSTPVIFFKSHQEVGHLLGRHQLEVKNLRLHEHPAFWRLKNRTAACLITVLFVTLCRA